MVHKVYTNNHIGTFTHTIQMISVNNIVHKNRKHFEEIKFKAMNKTQISVIAKNKP